MGTKHLRGLILCLLVLGLSSCAERFRRPDPKPAAKNYDHLLSKEDRERIAHVEQIGKALFQIDAIAAKGTDVLFDRVHPDDIPRTGGWIVQVHDGATYVSFFDEKDGKVSLYADIIFDGIRPTIITDPEREPSSTEVSKFRARQVGLSTGANNCTDRFNTVVLPSERPNAWDVYVLAATMDPDLVMTGGNMRITVSAEDYQVLEEYAYTRSCITLKKPAVESGEKIEFFSITHIVDDIPSPIHVYLNLLHNIPFAVGTERGLWQVHRGRITYFGPLGDETEATPDAH